MPEKPRSLGFAIRPSLETNDHEVRILVDGEDILGLLDAVMGLDPIDFFTQPAIHHGGRLMIGRCGCGVIGCDDAETTVTLGEETVAWAGNGGDFSFPADAYRASIMAAAIDRSWENVNRRAERLVGDVLSGMIMADGSPFQWASARIERRVIKVSFKSGAAQTLLQFGWDGEDAQSAVRAARAFRQDYG